MSYMHQANPQQQMPQLPVSIDRVEGGFVHNPYQTPPMHPAFQNLPPAFQSIVPAICGGLVHRAQNNARNNPARTFFFNLLSSNQYNNQFYHDTVLGLLDILMAKAVLTGRDPRTMTEDVVEQMMLPLVGKVVVYDFPQLQSYLPQDSYQTAMMQYENYRAAHQEALQHGPRGRQMFEQMFHQNAGQPQMGGYGPAPQQTGQGWYQNPQMGGPFGMQNGGGQMSHPAGHFPNAPSNQHMAAGAGQMQNFFSTPNVGSAPTPQRQLYQGGRVAEKDFMAGQREMHPSNAGGSPVAEAITPDGRYHDYRSDQERQRDQQQRGYMQQTLQPQGGYTPPVQASTPPPAQQSESPKATPVETVTLDNGVEYEVTTRTPLSTKSRPWDSWKATQKKNGEEETFIFVPEHLSAWDIDDPMWLANIACDPRTQLRCHAKSLTTGIVRQAVVEYKEDGEMDYLRNEVNPVYRVKGGAPRFEIPAEPNWEEVQKIRPLKFDDDEESQEEIEDLKNSPTPFEVPETFVGESLQEAEFKRDLFFLEHELDGDLHNKTHEFGYGETVKFLDLKTELSDESLLVETVAAIAVGNDVTIPSFHHDFVGLKGVIDDRVWHFLNDACTQRVNEVLSNNMGKDLASWNIDDFANDFPDLREALTEFYGDEEKAQDVFELFEKHARKKVILGGYRVVVGEELDTYIKENLKDLGTSHSLVRDRMLVLRRDHTVTQVDWETADMPELFDGTESLLVVQAKRQKLYNSLKDIQERARKRHKGLVSQCMIRTRDNVTMVIEHGAFNTTHLMLRIVSTA